MICTLLALLLPVAKMGVDKLAFRGPIPAEQCTWNENAPSVAVLQTIKAYSLSQLVWKLCIHPANEVVGNFAGGRR